MPNGSPPARADARRNRARLIAAARELFAEVGTVDAAMNDVARRAGVGPGTLWRHFPNKDALVAEVMAESLDGLAALGRELRAEPDAAAAVRRWAEALVQHVGRYRGLAATIAALAAGADRVPGAACHEVEVAADELVESAVRAGGVRPDLTGADLIRLATAVAWAAEAAGEPDAAGRLLDMAFDGIVTGPGRA